MSSINHEEVLIIKDLRRNKIIYIGTLNEYSIYQEEQLNICPVKDLRTNMICLYKEDKKIRHFMFGDLYIPYYLEITKMETERLDKVKSIIDGFESLMEKCKSLHGSDPNVYLQFAKIYDKVEKSIKSALYSLIQYPVDRKLIDFIARQILKGRKY